MDAMRLPTAATFVAVIVSATVIAPANATTSTPPDARASAAYTISYQRAPGNPYRWKTCVPHTWTTRGANSRDLRELKAATATISRASRVAWRYTRNQDAEIVFIIKHTRGASLKSNTQINWRSLLEADPQLIDGTATLTLGSKSNVKKRYQLYLQAWGFLHNLGRVGDSRQTMGPRLKARGNKLGAGDRAGLARLAAFPCQVPPAPATDVWYFARPADNEYPASVYVAWTQPGSPPTETEVTYSQGAGPNSSEDTITVPGGQTSAMPRVPCRVGGRIDIVALAPSGTTRTVIRTPNCDSD